MLRRLFCLVAIAFLLCFLFSQSSNAQIKSDDRVPKDRKAILAANIDVQKFYQNKLIKMLVDFQLRSVGDIPLKVEDFTKISALVAAPQKLDPQSMASVNFYAYVGFKETMTSATLKQMMMDSGAKEVSIKGKNLIALPGELGIYFDMRSKYMLVGTEEYLTSPSNQFATKNLAEVYASLPDSPIRIAVDLDGARELFDQLSTMADQSADASTKPYVSLIDDISSIGITSDLDNGSIFRLLLNGHDQAGGKTIKQKMDGLLPIAKRAIEYEGPEVEAGKVPREPMNVLMTAPLKDLKADQKGKSVIVEIKKPAGYEEPIVKMQEESREEWKFRLVLIALQNYSDIRRNFPFGKHVEAEDNDNGFSWAVHLLRFMGKEEGELLKRIDLNGGYKSEQNAPFGEEIPKIMALSSGQIMWVRPSKIPKYWDSIKDGSSNTICFVQSRKVDKSPWTKPTSIKPAEVIVEFNALKDGESMIIGMYDGSVHRISNKNDLSDIEAMLEPADGKVPKNFFDKESNEDDGFEDFDRGPDDGPGPGCR